MTNSQAWDRVADKYGDPAEAEVVQYGVDLPTEAELRLCGDMTNKRVLDLGSGRGANAVTFARQAAHVIAIDSAASALAAGHRLPASTGASSGTKVTSPISRSCAPTLSTSRSPRAC
jgi:2-polyprenyl-3-methyl-5-hydroxy-6-metoxy-1,4-benzoquinol methylase